MLSLINWNWSCPFTMTLVRCSIRCEYRVCTTLLWFFITDPFTLSLLGWKSYVKSCGKLLHAKSNGSRKMIWYPCQHCIECLLFINLVMVWPASRLCLPTPTILILYFLLILGYQSYRIYCECVFHLLGTCMSIWQDEGLHIIKTVFMVEALMQEPVDSSTLISVLLKKQ